MKRLLRTFVATAAWGCLGALACAADGTLKINVVDADTRQPIACRMHLKDGRGRPVKPPRLPAWNDHFVFPGTVSLELPRGNYTFEIERGPEYVNRTGHFTINDFADDETTVDLRRVVDMAAENWFSGELHIHRPRKDIELLMQAEDLHVAPLITWWNRRSEWASGRVPKETVVRFDGNRYYDIMAGEDERGGGALLYFGLPAPLPIATAEREHPSSATFLELAKETRGVWVDVEKPFWWDMPIWLASGKVDSIGIAHNHMHQEGVRDDEAWGRARDKSRYAGPLGNGRWTQDIYYHVLNSGLRIPPSAGSASGVLPPHVGYNRMYVWVDKEQFDYDSWWEGFKLGRVVVTNGPLIRPLANGRLPGHVFRAGAGDTVSIDISMNLTTRDKLSYLEVIRNGLVAQTVPLGEWAKNGHFPPLEFDESGWFLVRVVADLDNTYRFASSAPWYVEIGDEPNRISKASAQFFLDWLEQRASQLRLDDASKQAEVMQFVAGARQFWSDRVAAANAD